MNVSMTVGEKGRVQFHKANNVTEPQIKKTFLNTKYNHCHSSNCHAFLN